MKMNQRNMAQNVAFYPEEDRVTQYYRLEFSVCSLGLLWKYICEGRKFKIFVEG